MSLLLDALRKSANERRLGQTPPLEESIRQTPPELKRRSWLAPVLLLLIAALVLIWQPWRDGQNPAFITADDAVAGPVAEERTEATAFGAAARGSGAARTAPQPSAPLPEPRVPGGAARASNLALELARRRAEANRAAREAGVGTSLDEAVDRQERETALRDMLVDGGLDGEDLDKVALVEEVLTRQGYPDPSEADLDEEEARRLLEEHLPEEFGDYPDDVDDAFEQAQQVNEEEQALLRALAAGEVPPELAEEIGTSDGSLLAGSAELAQRELVAREALAAEQMAQESVTPPVPSVQSRPAQRAAPVSAPPVNDEDSFNPENAVDVLSYYDLPAHIRTGLPEVNVQIRVYDEDPERRFVVSERNRVREGEELGAGLTLHEIRRDGVVLAYQSYLFIWDKR